jgi:hypothetical protein
MLHLAVTCHSLPPKGRFKTVIQAEYTFVSDDLSDTVHGSLVFTCTVPVLQANLHQLKRDHYNALGCPRRASSQDRETLCRFRHSESVAISLAPPVIGSVNDKSGPV